VTTIFPILAFTALGTLSPLATFLRLFQMKEWRWDRLTEHLRREGPVSQLFSNARLMLLALSVFGLFLFPHPLVSLYVSSLLACLSVLQIAVGKQPMPVWTTKALILGALSMGITMAAVWIAPGVPLLPVLAVVLQPAIVLLAWALFLPIDRKMKEKVFAEASALRDGLLENAVVIGIAGSVGKTTTKELLKHLLQDLSPLSTPAHVNTEMGVAQWLLNNEKLIPGKPLIIEMGAYAKGEIKLLCGIVRPTIGVVTALGSDHLALFGSEEAIIDANAELVESLPENGHAFLNGDNEATRSLASRMRCPAALVGTHEGDHMVALDIEERTDGLHFRLDNEDFAVPLHGRHHVTNVLLAVSVAAYLQVPLKRIQELLKTFHPLSHTFNVLEENSVTILDDTYNVSPLSFRAALDWAANRKETPKILLTSGLLELGRDEEKFLRELGRKAAFFDRVIFTTPKGKDVFETELGKKAELFSASTEKIAQGSLLACVGRMPISTIRHLLP